MFLGINFKILYECRLDVFYDPKKIIYLTNLDDLFIYFKQINLIGYHWRK